MVYLIVLVLIFIFELLYFRIANRYNIIDKPNERSSHTQITFRGGGIVFWLSALLYLSFHFSTQSLWFFIGISVISIVSFADDVVGLGQMIRFLSHLLAITCVFVFANVFNTFPWWAIAIGYFVLAGIVNAYNFMDGINGITGLYSLVVLSLLQYVNYYIAPFVEPNMIWFPMIASVVFLFFNFRKQAMCFAGDVGSTSIAFWVVTLLLLLVMETNNLIWLGFLMVYGVDSVCTILYRIYLKQNILQAHRMHLYQVLTNERGMGHRVVATIYAVVQLIVSVLIIWLYPVVAAVVLVVAAVVLVGVYVRAVNSE